MLTRVQRKFFKAGTWSTDAELQAFIEEIEDPTLSDFSKMLGDLLDPKLFVEIQHANRCQAFSILVRKHRPRELFAPLADGLRQGDASFREMAIELLPIINHVEGHRVLCQVLGHANPDVRRDAARVLGELGEGPAFQSLVMMVHRNDFHGRADALSVMVPKAGQQSLDLIAAVYQSGAPKERAIAVRYLNARIFKKNAEPAARFLLQALHDPHERVVAQALRNFSQIVSERSFFQHTTHLTESSNSVLVRALIEALRVYKSPRTIAFLSKVIRTRETALIETAIESLEHIATEDVLLPLIEAVRDPRMKIRGRAVEALVVLGKSGAVDVARTVIWLLKDRDVNVRRMAAEVTRLVGVQASEITPKLIRFLRDEDWWVRERVMDALIDISGKELSRYLVTFLEDPSPVFRRYAIGALRRIKDPAVLGALVKVAMDDPDWWTREEAISTVGELQDPRAVPYLIRLLQDESNIRFVTIEALIALGAREATPLVGQSLQDDDDNVRAAAVRFLGHFDARAFAGDIAEMKNDSSEAVRLAVRQVSQMWKIHLDEVVVEESLTALEQLLLKVHEEGADDLILSSGNPPYLKRIGRVEPIHDVPIDRATLTQMLYATLSPELQADLDGGTEVDYCYQIKSRGLRFRGNVFHQLTGPCAVFRSIRSNAMQFDDLGLPAVVRSFASLRNGLVLVGGPTGSGKSTTLASLVDHINRTESKHIVTIEDPIETVHRCNKSLLNQREVGTDTASFYGALRSTLRQDPDVILVGEMRDLETISFALAAAETGHLVFGTVHTVSADTSIDRLLNVFDARQRPQVRSMLSETLRAVVCQHLVPRRSNPLQRVLAVEVMVNDTAIANLIRKDKTYQIPSVLTTSREFGMQSMDYHLGELVRAGIVSFEHAFMKANDKAQFENLVAVDTGVIRLEQRLSINRQPSIRTGKHGEN